MPGALAGVSAHEQPRRLVAEEGALADGLDLVTPTLTLRRDAGIADLGARIAAL